MQHSTILLLVVLATSPLGTTAAISDCFGGVYAPNSTYEANLRRLAAILSAQTASSQRLEASRDLGYWPNRVRAFSRCYPDRHQGFTSSSCAACVAAAFREAETACPHITRVIVFLGNCTLALADYPRSIPFFGPSSWFEFLGAGLLFQAIGFAWLFFLLLQEWRDKRRASMMRSSSIPSGDQ
ncbi:cysteine-rich receptor-like protein kinase 10 [Lolium rigidum]|uniref:cysteine-rich receptor-like protein kinase 10 n=1 Tax=Lolium rigidum TaxID=89674 RepID=UPI001F5D25E3|nr:cysteine-rich receptor-like protein kinase 10 [Lolium rigidum]